jgi:hypothetical protein
VFALILTAAIMSQAADAPQVSSRAAPPVPAQPNVEVVGPNRQPRVCRIERGTGSRVNVRRICQTQAEREAEMAQRQRDAENGVNATWDRQQGDRPFGQFANPEGTRIRSSETAPAGFPR